MNEIQKLSSSVLENINVFNTLFSSATARCNGKPWRTKRTHRIVVRASAVKILAYSFLMPDSAQLNVTNFDSVLPWQCIWFCCIKCE